MQFFWWHSISRRTNYCGLWPNKSWDCLQANITIICRFLSKSTIWFVRFRPLTTFNRRTPQIRQTFIMDSRSVGKLGPPCRKQKLPWEVDSRGRPHPCRDEKANASRIHHPHFEPHNDGSAQSIRRRLNENMKSLCPCSDFQYSWNSFLHVMQNYATLDWKMAL